MKATGYKLLKKTSEFNFLKWGQLNTRQRGVIFSQCPQNQERGFLSHEIYKQIPKSNKQKPKE